MFYALHRLHYLLITSQTSRYVPTGDMITVHPNKLYVTSLDNQWTLVKHFAEALGGTVAFARVFGSVTSLLGTVADAVLQPNEKLDALAAEVLAAELPVAEVKDRMERTLGAMFNTALSRKWCVVCVSVCV